MHAANVTDFFVLSLYQRKVLLKGGRAMATRCSVDGVTVVEIDENGKVAGVRSGYAGVWSKDRPQGEQQGSPEWLREIVVSDTRAGLQSVVDKVRSGAIRFDGSAACGTSRTSCRTAVFFEKAGNIEKPSTDSYNYSVLAQGTWVEPATQGPGDPMSPTAQYYASTLFISKHLLSEMPAFATEWESGTKEADFHMNALLSNANVLITAFRKG